MRDDGLLKTDEVASDARLSVLLADYEQLRDDDRTGLASQIALFGLAGGVLALFTNLVTKTCQADNVPGCDPLPDVVLAAAPFAPLALISLVISIGASLTLRSFQMRAVERTIRDILGPEREETQYPGLPVVSNGEVSVGLNSMSGSGGAGAWINTTAILGLAVVFVGLTGYIASIVSLPWRILMVGLYSLATLSCLSATYRVVVQGRRFFATTVTAIQGRLTSDLLPRPRRARRSLVAYLVLPRPADIVKLLILPAAFFVGLVLVDDPQGGVIARVVVVFVCLELLIYPARYIVNDLRGLGQDEQHPANLERGRLSAVPGSVIERTHAALLAVVVRLWFVLTLAVLPTGSAPIIILLLVLVVATAIPYEWLRSRQPDPTDTASVRRIGLAICLWVGTGYAIRGAGGLLAAGATPWGSPGVFAGTCVFLWSFGVVFVTLAWVLDATSHVISALPECPETDARSEADCSAGASEPAGSSNVSVPTGVIADAALGDKPHLLMLLWQTGSDVLLHDADDCSGPQGRNIAALRDRGRLPSLWNIAFAVATCSAAVLCQVLLPNGTVGSAASLMVVHAVGAASYILCNRTSHRFVTALAVAAVLVGVSLARTDEPWVVTAAVVPWAALAVVTAIIRNSSWAELQPAALRKAVVGVGHALLSLIVGRKTAELYADERPSATGWRRSSTAEQ